MSLYLTLGVIGALALAVQAALGFFATTRPPATRPRKVTLEIAFVAISVVGVIAVIMSIRLAEKTAATVDYFEADTRHNLSRLGVAIAKVDHDLHGLTAPSPHPSADVPRQNRLAPREVLPKIAAISTKLNERSALKITTVKQLRDLWILSHDVVSKEMRDGTEWPPEDWINEQLEKYGNSWRVKVNGSQLKFIDDNAMQATTVTSRTDDYMGISFGEESYKLSDDSGYVLQVGIYTDNPINVPELGVGVDGEITSASIQTQYHARLVGLQSAVVGKDKKVFIFRFTSPEFSPADPLIVTIQSPTQIKLTDLHFLKGKFDRALKLP